MSCFESSTFLRNPEFFDVQLLAEAVQKLNWGYQLNGDDIIINRIGKRNFRGEFAMKITEGIVIYNSFYLKNGIELLGELKEAIRELNVEYATHVVVSEFEKLGFRPQRIPLSIFNSRAVRRMTMVGYSYLPHEDEPRTEIEFSILNDGTAVSDSNYIPEDVHELADKAMENIEKAFGRKRREGIEIIRKKIPFRYKDKSYCAVKKNQTSFKNKTHTNLV